ncbi:MAG: MraY family glycosyltransferase [Chloroflexota bacterium]|nr:MraY family glycosyltransferase [Chloroflexota bacterium]
MSSALVGLTAVLASLVLSMLVIRAGHRLKLLHHPGPGRVHSSPVVRLGGLAIMPAFLLAMALGGGDFEAFGGVYIGVVLITGIGLVDDLFGMRPALKLAGQTAVALTAVSLGVRISVISNPFGGVIELDIAVGGAMTVFWLVGMMNAVNLLDGLDGLAPGVVLVSAVILAVLSSQLGNEPLLLFGLALAGAIAGFLPLNAYRARLILGDSGSNVLGFLIGCMAVLGQAKIGTTLLVLGIPILDVAWTLIRRRLSGRSITARDTEHLHHRLLQFGLSKYQVTMVYVALCTAFGAAALLLDRAEKLFGLAALTGVTALLLFLGAKKTPNKDQSK